MLRFLLFAALLLIAMETGALAETARPVWLVSNGFHSALAVRTRDLSAWREISSDPHADVLLIGWGDAAYYRGQINPCTIMAALFWPTPSIMHVVPVRGSIAARFGHSDVIELPLAPSQHRALWRAVNAAFARDASGRRIFLQRGYFPASRFYAGCESFYFPRMCNLWVAEKLRDARVPVCAPCAVFAGGLSRQAGKSGRRIQSRRRPLDGF